MEDSGHILEPNVYVRLVPDRVKFDPESSCGYWIGGGDFCTAACKQPGGDHKPALCCSSSLLSFLRATATNLDVFSRLIPF